MKHLILISLFLVGCGTREVYHVEAQTEPTEPTEPSLRVVVNCYDKHGRLVSAQEFTSSGSIETKKGYCLVVME